MRQFDVHRNPSTSARAFAPYLVVLSSHHLVDIDDVIVAPLINDAGLVLGELEIEVDLDSERLVLTISELSTMERRRLGRAISSLLSHEYDIRRALDRLFTGF